MIARDYLLFVVRPALAALNLGGGVVAERLVLGTMAQESRFTSINQITSGAPKLGPGIGVCQCEAWVLEDVLTRLQDKNPAAAKSLHGLAGDAPQGLAMKLASNAGFAAGVCRAHYWLIPAALPATPDPVLLGQWWKTWYNTATGKGTVADFVASYHALVEPALIGV